MADANRQSSPAGYFLSCAFCLLVVAVVGWDVLKHGTDRPGKVAALSSTIIMSLFAVAFLLAGLGTLGRRRR